MRTWIKLYTEIAHDRKMNLLTDRQFRTCINLFALAGIVDDGGILSSLNDLAYQLRISESDLLADMQALAQVHILREYAGVWMVEHWSTRQAKPPSDSPEAILVRVHKHRAKQRNESVTPLQNVTENVTSCNEPVTDVTTRERIEEKERENAVPIFTPPPPIPSFSRSNGSGYKAAETMTILNGKLGPELRTPLANMILKIAGLTELAEVEENEKLLPEAHNAAVEVYGIGYRTEDDLLPAEDDWYEHDFRGQKGERPTIDQFRKHAARFKAGRRVAPPPRAAEVWGDPA